MSSERYPIISTLELFDFKGRRQGGIQYFQIVV